LIVDEVAWPWRPLFQKMLSKRRRFGTRTHHSFCQSTTWMRVRFVATAPSVLQPDSFFRGRDSAIRCRPLHYPSIAASPVSVWSIFPPPLPRANSRILVFTWPSKSPPGLFPLENAFIFWSIARCVKAGSKKLNWPRAVCSYRN